VSTLPLPRADALKGTAKPSEKLKMGTAVSGFAIFTILAPGLEIQLGCSYSPQRTTNPKDSVPSLMSVSVVRNDATEIQCFATSEVSL